MTQHPDATILWLRDSEGLFPYVRFSGDTDMVTDGWMSFTSTSRNEVVIASLAAGEASESVALERISSALNRSDLREIRLLRVEQETSAAGLSFQAFRAAYVKPTIVYSSLSGIGEAGLEREQSIDAFRREGGIVTLVPS